ncbi:acyl-CoA dehydrogenase family protein [Nocardia sp. NPDC052278]|uniref:acyl-CoA dehydrogenase family protein n=1 Tax=unclassified Nocardia TaxID=2637762 RepID=UPI0036B1C879
MTEDLDTMAAALFADGVPRGNFVPKIGYEDELSPSRAWLRRLAARGWSTPTWPAQYGGCDASPARARQIRATVARHGPRPPELYAFGIGTGIVGPTILTHGTPEQCAKWLPPISRGDEIFCQMFSEPEAGSDLANVSLRAERFGANWRLDGQKIWTSRAAYADWGLCLARTTPDLPKHQGMTMFVIDMHDPGIEVRPLRQMNGDARFNEIFVRGAVVPDAWRIGEVGAGWTVAMTVLANERTAMAAARSSRRRDSGRHEPEWLRALAAHGALSDPVVRDRAMRVYILERVAAWTAMRAATGTAEIGAASGGKLRQTRVFKARAELIKDASGAAGMVSKADDDRDFLTAPSMSLMGGTDEVQLNVLGEQVLGLPKEPRLDRDVPWAVSRRGLF